MPVKKDIGDPDNPAQERNTQGKNADEKAEVKPERKQISVYLNVDKIQEIKVYCALNNIKLNDFYETALLEKLQKNQ